VSTDKWANPQAVWDRRYGEPEPLFGLKPNVYLEAQSKRLTPGANILVPGDGYGRNGLWLARQGFSVHTVDLSSVGVERARKAAQAAGLRMTIEQADLATWPWPVNRFDAAAAIFVHLPSAVRRHVHASMLRALKSGGLAIIECFTPRQIQFSSGGPKDLDMLCTADLLREEFAGAEILELEEKTVRLEEGHKHSGMGAVVQGVFRAP
jgi:SAM-dependent methyltransferase